MQDNFTPDIDPDWVEEGWSGMRQMLDQEMPVQQRRPFVWVWWSAALLAIGIGTGWLLKDYADQRTAIGQLPVPFAGAEASQYPERLVAEQEVAVAGTKASGPISDYTPPTTVATHQASAALNASLMALPAAQSEPDAPVQENSRAASAMTSIEQEKPITLSPTLTAIPPLNTLVALRPTPLEKQNLPSLPEQPEINDRAKASPWQPGLFISGLYGPEQGTAGYEAGIFLAWEPEGSRWYSRLNLSYLRLGAEQQVEEQQFAFSNSRFSNNPALVDLTKQVEMVHFANTALRAGYQITPRLGLEGGFFIAYLTGARQADTWTSAGAPGNSGGTDGSADNLSALNLTNRSQSTAGLSRWNAGCTAGLRYKFSNNFFTTLNYSAPLTDLSATTDQTTALKHNIALSLFGSF
jgi:hypothetical protein